MSTSAIKALERELGELLERHKEGGRTAEFQELYADDFLGFVEIGLGETTLTDEQKAVAASVMENQTVHLQTNHSAGKDFLAGRLALWWALCRGGLCIISGPTERQVKEILFASEIRTAWRKLRGRVRGELRTQRLEVPGAGRIVGFTATGLSQFTGWHHPKGVLVILTEAQGLESYVYKGAYACIAGAKDRLLCVGNPHNPVGPFWKASENPAWSRFRFSALDHPNVVTGEEIIPGAVTRKFVDLIRREFGEGSPEWQSQVLGRFPTSSEFGLLSRPAVDAAVLKFQTEYPRGTDMVVGVDLGRDRDPTVLAFLYGDTITEIIELPPDGDMTITHDKIEAELYAREFRPRAYGLASQGRLVLDCSGLGALSYDWMKSRGWNVGKQFLGGATAYDSDRYANVRAESMFQFKRLVEDGELGLPPDEMLIEECTAIQWYTNSASRKICEKKDVLRSRIGRSIDRLDACSMATYRRRGRFIATGGGCLVTF